MKVTILGCGTSTGVPRLPGDWGDCDPDNPKNRRRRASILVEEGGTTVLVDCGPDMRMQLLDAGVDRLDAVLVTHDHADHTHGIDDLRGFYQESRDQVPLYAAPRTLEILRRRFDYIFDSRHGYPPIVAGREIDGPLKIGALAVTPFEQAHGPITSLGFRFGDIAYSTDVADLPDDSVAALEGVKIWIVDALRYKSHPSHFSLGDAMGFIERIGCERAILTHMNNKMDYDKLVGELPNHIEPAYDGMVISRSP